MTYIGKGGFWEGKADGKEGWFPRLAIKEVDDEEFDYATLSRGASTASSVQSVMPTPTPTSLASPASASEVPITRYSRS